PDVIPALPPREEPVPASPRDAAGGDDYPPPDRVPAESDAAREVAAQEATPPGTAPSELAAAAALPPPDNALGAPPLAYPEVIPALPAVQLQTRAGHRLLAIDPQVRPYKVNVPLEYTCPGRIYVSQIQICVSNTGFVTSLRILKHSIDIIDLQLGPVISRWRYHPYLVDGRATPFCYVMNYRVR
ncbi:MAG TPA: hypothetical protein VMG12_30770, partial [Polyangiaceae bacterium]|nr:hypothetical protein [Polyangiaceae bacterium]